MILLSEKQLIAPKRLTIFSEKSRGVSGERGKMEYWKQYPLPFVIKVVGLNIKWKEGRGHLKSLIRKSRFKR